LVAVFTERFDLDTIRRRLTRLKLPEEYSGRPLWTS